MKSQDLYIYLVLLLLLSSSSCESSQESKEKGPTANVKFTKYYAENSFFSNIFEDRVEGASSIVVNELDYYFETTLGENYYSDSTNIYLHVFDDANDNEYLLFGKQNKSPSQLKFEVWDYTANLLIYLKQKESIVQNDTRVYALQDKSVETVFMLYTDKFDNELIYTVSSFTFRDNVKYELTLKSRDISSYELAAFKTIYTTLTNDRGQIFTPYSKKGQFVVKVNY